AVAEQNGYYVIHKAEKIEKPKTNSDETPPAPPPPPPPPQSPPPPPPNPEPAPVATPPQEPEPMEFLLHKLQYQQGSEVEAALKKIGVDMQYQPDAPTKLLRAIQS